jgi:hypothetical protein
MEQDDIIRRHQDFHSGCVNICSLIPVVAAQIFHSWLISLRCPISNVMVKFDVAKKCNPIVHIVLNNKAASTDAASDYIRSSIAISISIG